MKSFGPIIGSGIMEDIDMLIYVVPELYGILPNPERHKIARLVGKLNHIKNGNKHKIIFLAGPGRWATSSPSLGVPVEFQEINNVSIICEIAEMHKNLVPSISLGTHFFNDLVESDMLYIAIEGEGAILNKEKIHLMKNYLPNLLPEAEQYRDIIKVLKNSSELNEPKMYFYSDPVKQIAILYLE